jgi:ABC-2 type transport system permease protein
MNKTPNSLFKSRGKVRLFFSYYTLYAKTIIFSPLNMFLGVYLNIFIMVSWLAFKQGDSFLLSSVVGTGIIRNAMYTFTRSLLNMKRVGINARLRVVPTSRRLEIGAACSWNFTYNLAVSCLLIGIACIFMPTQREMFTHVNWGMYLSGYFLLWLSSIIMAYVLYYSFKVPEISQSFAIIMYVIAYTFFGCAFPFAAVSKIQWLSIILYLFPQRYALNIMQAGWVNATTMRYSHPEWDENVDWGFGGHLWIPYVVSVVVIALLIMIMISIYVKANAWHKKDQYGISLIQAQGDKYIKMIKRATSIAELDKIRAEFRKKEHEDFHELKKAKRKKNPEKVAKTKNKI